MARKALGPAALAVVRAVRVLLEAEPNKKKAEPNKKNVEPNNKAAVTVACSGGPDSLALAAAAAYAAEDPAVLIVDHGLQEGSADVARRVAAQLREWADREPNRHIGDITIERGDAGHSAGESGRADAGVPACVDAEPVGAQQSAGGPEAAARRARYAIFERYLAHAGGILLLGHTLDDQAEQVLLGLARGSGARSLGGMPASRDAYRRPLLNLRRADTERACAEFGLEPWRDPHNDDHRFARVRVRNRVLPVLERELGPGVAEALARSAAQLAIDDDYLTETAANVWPGNGREYPALPVGLATTHPAIRRRILRAWLLHHGARDLSMTNILAVDRLLTDYAGQRFVEVPGLRIERAANTLRAMEE